MAYRLALSGAVGPYVGPWIRPVGTEYAVDSDGSAVLEVDVSEAEPRQVKLSAQRNPFPEGVGRYRIVLEDNQRSPVSVRVYLR